MRLFFVDSSVVELTRQALLASAGNWDDHFHPDFEAPPAPEGIPELLWPRLAEHVARAERVAAMIRSEGLEASEAEYGDSPHASEVATVVAAAAHVGQVTFEQLEALFTLEVDDLIAYGEFISLLLQLDTDRDRIVELYEQFCTAVSKAPSDQPDWDGRVDSVQDGLASLYVQVGRIEDAHELFKDRHKRSPRDLTAALAASRSFLSAGQIGRARQWLELGAVRADQLDRPMMAFRLRKKAEVLRRRTA